MNTTTVSSYAHTQRGPWAFLLFLVAIVMAFTAFATQSIPVMTWMFVSISIAMFVLTFCFFHLTVADRGDHLLVQFGPLPLFFTRISYEDIQSVEIGKTTLLDGWGIHLSLRGGWVWNIWGWDCVDVRHKRLIHIGTDDAEELAAFLRSKMALYPPTAGR